MNLPRENLNKFKYSSLQSAIVAALHYEEHRPNNMAYSHLFLVQKRKLRSISFDVHVYISATARGRKHTKLKLYTDYKQNHMTRLLIHMRYFEKKNMII